MKYQGSKQRIAKYILPIILEDKEKYEYYVEPFCGGLGTMDKVSGIKRVANDINPFLIAMWQGLQMKMETPMEIPKTLYDEYRNKYNVLKKKDNSFNDIRNILQVCYPSIATNPPEKLTLEKFSIFYEIFLIGWIGYMGSFNGRFYDGGYSGKTDKRDYIDEQIRNTLKQSELIVFNNEIFFTPHPYDKLPIKPKSIIYCDIPYRNTKQYEFSKKFDYEDFYDWCRKISKKEDCKIFISEYEMPEDFKCVWEMEVTNSMHPTKTKKPIEKLFTL